jgi:activator of 2-hydroxyglutaryl-CoA dehydratase
MMTENADVKRTMILTGGMVKCPGLVERVKLELKDYNFEIVVDEDFNWKNIHLNTTSERMFMTPVTVG